MPTKVNILDFARVTDVQTTAAFGGIITTEVKLTIIADTEEEYEIVMETLMDNINGGAS